MESSTKAEPLQKKGDAGPSTEKELLDSVRKQMEFYFSAENLKKDSFLVSQMDSNRSVPISIIMKVILQCPIYISILTLGCLKKST